MSSIVERLRDQGLVIQHPERKQIADLLEQQAERIKELEAALCEEVEARSKWYCEAARLKEELAALRQRIDDAPVLRYYEEPFTQRRRTLISKEDLK